MAVRDNVNRIRENIHTDIPSQFPRVYREDGELFVEFVKAYYEYVDSELPKFRDAFYARNVDTTDFDKFLIYFKNKYMTDFPYEGSVDLRFIIKHITDLYRRKGTEESLRLFFRMFFDEEVEVFYPSTSILKPSDSKFGSNTYLEMRPVRTVFSYPLTRGSKIRGDTSKAEAFIDEIIFKNFNGAIVPIVFISALNGKFITDDGITITDGSGTRNVGKLISGSISSNTVRKANRLPYNEVGDKVNLVSAKFGVEAKGIVTKISETITGVIEFEVEDGGYGYAIQKDGVSLEDSDPKYNTLYITNQVLITPLNSEYDIQDLDTITFTNADVYNSNGTLATGFSQFTTTVTAITQTTNNNLVYLEAPNDDIPLVEGNYYFDGVNDRTGETLRFVGSAQFKDEASFEISSLKNTETVKLIPDIIGDFVNVQLDATDYGMSGSSAETLTTPIRDAFEVNTWVIGEIDKIRVLNSGEGYKNDVVSVIKMPEISNFDHRDIGLTFDRVDFLLEPGNIITQTIQIEDLTYPQPTTTYISYTVQLKFVRREKDVFYFRPMRFYQVDPDLPITIKGDTYNIVKIIEDETSTPMGQNANISGRAFFAQGQVDEVKVIETGYKYEDDEDVNVVNNEPTNVNYGETVATANVKVRGMGFTEGRWLTTTAMLNDPTKVIRDNLYYQEYSYDISSIVNPDSYETLVKNEIAPAGTKLFSSPLINSFNDFDADVDIRMEIYTVNEELYTSENGEQDQNLQARFYNDAYPRQNIIARNANLVEDETTALNEQINS